MPEFRLLDLTLPSPEENLALDEALLEDLEQHGGAPVLRFWESDHLFVVLGLAGSAADDVHLTRCRQDGIPVLRRASGGGTVLQGPGCLSYAFVLPLTLHPDLTSIRSTNRWILNRLAAALHPWHPSIEFRGISDLAVGGLKISGNAQRRRRNALLFHGTLLYGMEADLIARYLKQPARQPDYREDRPHTAFLGKLDAAPQALKQAIAGAWSATAALEPRLLPALSDALAKVLERSPEQSSLAARLSAWP